MRIKISGAMAALVFAAPLQAGAPDSVWRFDDGDSSLDGAWCAASVDGWMPRGESSASLSDDYVEGLLTVNVAADDPVNGLVLAVYRDFRPTWKGRLRAVHPTTPERAVVGWDESPDALVTALAAGDIATVETDPVPGERLPPVYAFSLKSSSAAVAQVLGCRDGQNPRT